MIPPAAVVDASVAVKWVIPEPDSSKALSLHATSLFAPDFLLTECGSVLWGKAQRKLISTQEAEARLQELQTFPVTLSAGLSLVAPALQLALKIGHPIYDCVYLALAEEIDAPLVTADQRFLKALQPHPSLAARVMHLADLP